MSHYACLVIIDSARELDQSIVQEEVERLMAPFMENCCAEPDKMYMKFYDEEDEYQKQYDDGSREMVVMPDGRLLLPWDDEFKKKPKKGEFPFPKAEPPKELERRQVPFKETYSTFEEFVAEWHGKKERDETYNRYGYFQNPNAKWDWYEIGGRWAGYFQLKPGHQGAKGSQYNFSGELAKSDGGRADVCFKNDIDFEAMRNKAETEAAKVYDAVQKAVEGTPPADSWEIVRSEFELKKAPQDIDVARKVYHDQPRVKAFDAFSRSEEGLEMIGFFTAVESFQIPREQYLLNARNGVGIPFAILKDGNWYEHGKMGWWGIVMDEKDPETWNAMASKLMDDLPGDTLLVITDCHI